jgi:hypothetical protein
MAGHQRRSIVLADPPTQRQQDGAAQLRSPDGFREIGRDARLPTPGGITRLAGRSQHHHRGAGDRRILLDRRRQREAVDLGRVNLMALPTRLIRIWRRRPGSLRSAGGTAVATSTIISSPFWCAFQASALAVSPMVSRGSKSIGSRSSRPASIREKSRMSMMTVSRASADVLTMSRFALFRRQRGV